MPISYVETTATTGQTHLNVPFPYLEANHVHVTVDQSAVSSGDFSFSSSNTIVLDTPLDGGETVRVFRTTPSDGVIYQAAPGVIDHRQVNRALLQLLYIIQEALDAAVEAVSLAGEFNSILDQVTAMYNAILGIYAQLTDALEFIQNLKVYYDLNCSLPYPPGAGERLAEWKVPEASRFDDTTASAWGGRMYATISAEFEINAYKVVYDDTDPDEPEEATTLLGTFQCNENEARISFARAGSGDINFAAGNGLRFVFGDTSNGQIVGLALSARLRRLIT